MVKAQEVALKFKQKEKNSKYSRAFNSLNTPLSTTHRYIKFKPNSEAHMVLAEDLFKNKSIVTKPHPMDQEIVQYGEDYVDPETTDERFPVFYASIPVNFSIPNIPYIVLEDLYLPKKDSKGDLLPDDLLLEGVSRFLTNNIDNEQIREIKENSLQFKSSKKEDMISNGKQTIQARGFWDWLLGSRYTPQGTVKVYDTNTNKYVPYKYASIEIYTWFDNAYAWADANGRYVSPERFRFGVGVYATWRNPTATIRSSWNEVLGLWVTDKLTNLGRTYNNKTTPIEQSDKHKWLKATTHLAFEKFNLFLHEKYTLLHNDNNPPKISGANVWVFSSNNNHRGSALMLNKFNNNSTSLIRSYFSNIVTIWLQPAALSANWIARLLGLKHLYPDLTLTYGIHTTKKIDELVFHESAHFIHAIKAGGDFWKEAANAQAKNIANLGEPYGDGTKPNTVKADLINLTEGWANFLEHRIMIDAYNTQHGYPNYVANSIRNEYGRMEKFYMRTPPFNNAIDFYSDGMEGWFISGLFWDLYDTNDDSVIRYQGEQNSNLNNGIGISKENVEGDIKAIFDLMTRNVVNPVDLENAIKQKYPEISQRVDNLFALYGY